MPLTLPDAIGGKGREYLQNQVSESEPNCFAGAKTAIVSLVGPGIVPFRFHMLGVSIP